MDVKKEKPDFTLRPSNKRQLWSVVNVQTYSATDLAGTKQVQSHECSILPPTLPCILRHKINKTKIYLKKKELFIKTITIPPVKKRL